MIPRSVLSFPPLFSRKPLDRADERAIIAMSEAIMMQMQHVRIGQTLTYDDGRQHHRNVKAVILATTPTGFIAQFEDRADTTTINWNDADWMRYIRFDGEN